MPLSLKHPAGLLLPASSMGPLASTHDLPGPSLDMLIIYIMTIVKIPTGYDPSLQGYIDLGASGHLLFLESDTYIPGLLQAALASLLGRWTSFIEAEARFLFHQIHR